MKAKKPESPEYAEYANQGACIAKKANKLFLDAMLSGDDSEKGDNDSINKGDFTILPRGYEFS